ncbi:MAG TPA: hypothetical protein VFZ47_03545 [Chitinophagaceae bacterium]
MKIISTILLTLIVTIVAPFLIILVLSCNNSDQAKEKSSLEISIDTNNIKGNWYLNKWTMYHTLSFSGTTVFVDNHIDSVFTLNYAFSKDTLISKHSYLPVIYKNKIIALTKDTLVIEGFGEENNVLMYSRTKKDLRN